MELRAHPCGTAAAVVAKGMEVGRLVGLCSGKWVVCDVG